MATAPCQFAPRRTETAPERRNGGLGYLRSCSAGNRILEGNDDRLDVARGSGNRRDRAGGLVLPGDGPAPRQHGGRVMAWNPPAPPEPPEPSVCDEMRGDCANCPERLECSMPDPPELDLDNMDDWGMNLYCEEEIVCD